MTIMDYCSISSLRIERTHPSLPGHFPNSPIVPGVLLLAHWQQLLHAHIPNARLRSLPSIKFLHPVLPEQTVWLALEVQALDAHQVRGRCLVRGDNRTLASGQFSAELSA